MLSKSISPLASSGMSNRESMAESWASAVAGAEVEVEGSALVFMPSPIGLASLVVSFKNARGDGACNGFVGSGLTIVSFGGSGTVACAFGVFSGLLELSCLKEWSNSNWVSACSISVSKGTSGAFSSSSIAPFVGSSSITGGGGFSSACRFARSPSRSRRSTDFARNW